MEGKDIEGMLGLLKEYLSEVRAYVMDCITSARVFVDLAKILGLINKSLSLLEEIEKELKKVASNRA